MTKTIETAVLWDWDNTLVDTTAAVSNALNDVTQAFDLPAVTPHQVRSIMGTYRGTYWQAFGDKMEEALLLYLDRYAVHSAEVTPFPAAFDVLDYIQKRGIPQFVVSNKRRDLLNAEVDRIGWRSLFAGVHGTGAEHDSKPNKSFAETALAGYTPKRMIMIGDGESDMMFARNIGAVSVLVHRSDDEKLWPHDFSCATIKDIKDLLSQLL